MKPPDVSSSEIAPHPGEVTHHLDAAIALLFRMSDAAKARGDAAGSDAWLAAAEAVARGTTAVALAKQQQDWAARRTEPCPTCKRLP